MSMSAWAGPARSGRRRHPWAPRASDQARPRAPRRSDDPV